MSYDASFTEIHTTDVHMPDVVAGTSCRRHGVGKGQACWDPTYSDSLVRAVCGVRIQNAARNGLINITIAPRSAHDKKSRRGA